MARLGRDLVPEDELILYYAGHNILLKEPRLGFWLPADAGISTARRWLSNRDVSQFLASVKARQVVLIVDGSFAGSSVPSYEPRLIDRALVEQYLPSRRAVMVFNSGGEEPVASEEMDGHSLLAYHLLRKLDRLPAEGAAGFDLFADLSGSIIQKVLQTPAYFPIIMAGHDDGMDFLFRRSLRRPAQTETVIPMGADARLDDLMWDAVAGKPEPFYRLLDLAQGGDHAAQSAVGRAFKYRNWSRHDKIRSLAWASVAAQRANDAKEVAEANQIGNQDLAVRADVNAFLDGLFRRHPDLRSPPMRPAPEGQP